MIRGCVDGWCEEGGTIRARRDASQEEEKEWTVEDDAWVFMRSGRASLEMRRRYGPEGRGRFWTRENRGQRSTRGLEGRVADACAGKEKMVGRGKRTKESQDRGLNSRPEAAWNRSSEWGTMEDE